MKTIAIDNGYYSTKVVHDNNLFQVRSRYTEDHDGDFEFDNKRYSLGHGTYNIDHDKAGNDLHKLLTYYVLSDLTEYRSVFNLVLSLPMRHFLEYKDSFAQYIKGSGVITTKLKDRQKIFSINDCFVYFQGAGALYANNYNEYKGKLIGLLDIGGLTAQGAIFEDLKPIPGTMFTIDAGSLILENKIKGVLNEKYRLNLQDYQIPYLTGYEKDIAEITQDHFKKIEMEMRKNGWDLKTLPILATGGGSIMMKVNEYIPHCTLTKNPVFDHVRGLSRIGGVIFK